MADSCLGINLCDGCGWCPDCKRYVGTPHVLNCACQYTDGHQFCDACKGSHA